MNESEGIRKDARHSSGESLAATHIDTLELRRATPYAFFETAISVIPKVMQRPAAVVFMTAAAGVLGERGI